MFSIGIVLLFFGFFGFRATEPPFPGLPTSTWHNIWFCAFLVGALLLIASLCVFAWRVLP